MMKFLRKFVQKKDENTLPKVQPNIITESNIDTAKISRNAIKVIKGINNAGFKAYLVGGAIRDLLLGKQPKDFDIVTDAHPNQVKEIFKNSILIGRRFKLVHVRFGNDIIEVATFRSAVKNDKQKSEKFLFGKKGLILRDNVFGTIDDDVWRRDITINACYYDLATDSIIDYTGSMADIKSRQIRVIGDPETRYAEDPVRMLRALRYAAKLDFSLEKATSLAIHSQKNLFASVSPDRLFVEVMKTFYGGFALKAYDKLQEYNLFSLLFPQLAKVLSGELRGYKFTESLLLRALFNTDLRYNSGKSLSTSYIFIVFMWPILQHNLYGLSKKNLNFSAKVRQAIAETLEKQESPIAIPKNIIETCEDVWKLQFSMVYREESKINDTLNHPKFRMAYDFLLLRAQAGEEVYNLATWWHDFVESEDEAKANMILTYTEKTKNNRDRYAKPRNNKNKQRRSGEKRTAR
ncbi:MAG: polynucleotide adenylyltransferase PcnB [Pseudomonadota bacterium]|nr:polynucleotide adenylyltransferase PcnB [Pseudomonadota bacterium]